MARSKTELLPVVALRGKVIFPSTTNITFDAGRLSSLKAIKTASENDSRFFVTMQVDATKSDITGDDLNFIGTVVQLKQVTQLPGSSIRVSVKGLYRAEIRELTFEGGQFMAVLSQIKPICEDTNLEEAYMRTAREVLKDITENDSRISKDAMASLNSCDNGEDFVNIAGNILQVKPEVKQDLLGGIRTIDRLRMLETVLNTELEITRLEKKIAASVRQSIEKNQKEYYLREQLKAIHNELGDDMEEKDELEERIKSSNMPKEVEEKALKELSRMGKMPSSAPEYNVLRTYIDWILDLPWGEPKQGDVELSEAVKILDQDHYGLEKIKERITEYFAVLKLTHGMNAPILCFVGPPGVGKTSVASSIARALGREFVRMSLGGVKDESEIRGHRKTYIGAMPGRIINGIKNAKTTNPVFLLDEIDKLSSDLRGDPASALLEVLDPAQNSTFRDRYIELPYDLSKVLFITTANTLDTIPRPLLDRMEIIELNGYTQEEKAEIAKRYLIPKKREANGLKASQITIDDEAISEIIDGYTMEAGVRSLERNIDAVCRKVAVKLTMGENKKIHVTAKNVHELLGARKREKEEGLSGNEIGAATGLAWTSVGGTTLTIEVSAMSGKGEILLTGKLGDVMKESARAAISYIRSNFEIYGIDEGAFEKTDIHVHVPEGATPKDGPSAGITMATAILSAFTKKPVRKDVAMTGEITLRGKVLPIGGLKEKALAAYRIGVTDIIIPADNKKDLEDIPENVREKLHFIPVTNVDAVFKTAIIGL